MPNSSLITFFSFSNILASARGIQIFFKVPCKIIPKTLDKSCCLCYGRSMEKKHGWPTTSIRANPEVLHQARVAAVTQKKFFGQWLEEAIVEKIDREQKLNKEEQ